MTSSSSSPPTTSCGFLTTAISSRSQPNNTVTIQFMDAIHDAVRAAAAACGCVLTCVRTKAESSRGEGMDVTSFPPFHLISLPCNRPVPPRRGRLTHEPIAPRFRPCTTRSFLALFSDQLMGLDIDQLAHFINYCFLVHARSHGIGEQSGFKFTNLTSAGRDSHGKKLPQWLYDSSLSGAFLLPQKIKKGWFLIVVCKAK
ncbi:hypothetical protein EJB05_27290 [Eragrostis curvula]|uniref:Uncharacterized protein n=1 Tax=Eragrostis curvula TaxID=38414 RepID=A0A5J9UNV2_9POAL|nr:hypothetical protein EJB05_27290 [Eragrostis curvula]